MSHRTRTAFLVALLVAPARALSADEALPAKDGAGPAAGETRSKAEIAADAREQFAKADANGDGVVKGDEIVKGWLERYDLDGDGKIGRSEFLEISSRPPKLRQPTPMRDPVARARSAMASFDRNKDGLVQLDEYPGDKSVFKSHDRNRDDALTLAEATSMAEDELADIRRKMKNPSRYDFLSLFDSDKDNDVSLDEYDGPMTEFRRYDKDDDGVVSYDELYPERMMERGRKEMTGPRPENLSILETMDKNGDGKVSREEFKGTEDAWKRLDRNRDGVVTLADAR